MNQRALTDYETQILENVRAHGCQVVSVFDPEDVTPSFSYSVGFWETVGQPEVIVFGLPHEIMHSMINLTLAQCRDGLQLEDWTEISGLLEGHRCIVRSVSPENIVPEFFNSAMWYRELIADKPMSQAVQIVWPGVVDALFPWEDGCSEIVREYQPALYRVSLNS